MLPFVGVPADGDGGSVNVLVAGVTGIYKKTSHKYLLSMTSVTFGRKGLEYNFILHTCYGTSKHDMYRFSNSLKGTVSLRKVYKQN